ncbi:MAG: DivIVA domain-containing protein [Acidimicrobiales bacterium]
MTTDAPRGPGAHNLVRHVSPDQVRSVGFERAPFGRRGLDELEVRAYLHEVADELALRDAEIARLAGENRQLKHALREWHRQLVGYDAAELVARTQQQIESQIAQAEAYSREREEEATRLYDDIIAEARRRALSETQRLVHDPGSEGPTEQVDQDWLARQRIYTDALLQALDALAAHVHATRQAFTFEVSRLGDIGEAADPSVAAAREPTDGGALPPLPPSNGGPSRTGTDDE